MTKQRTNTLISSAMIGDSALLPRIFWIIPGMVGLALGRPVSGQKAKHTWIVSLKSVIAVYHHNWSSRRTLARLDDFMLRDIGLTAEDRDREARKPFWR